MVRVRREGAALARFAAARHRRPPRAFFIYRRRLSGVSSASAPRPRRHHQPLRRPPTAPIPARTGCAHGLGWIRRAAQSGFAFHPSPSAPFFFSALAASDAAFGFADARGRPDGVVLAGTTDSAAVVEVDALPIDRSVASTCTLGGRLVPKNFYPKIFTSLLNTCMKH